MKLKPCPFCRGTDDLTISVSKCDRVGWEKSWEPSITCLCGINFGIGFYGEGCNPDRIRKDLIKTWNHRVLLWELI